MKAMVVGAGVSGLSTGIVLAENGHEVDVWAKDMPLETTSAAAAAFFEPYLVKPEEKLEPWCRISYDYFKKIAELTGDAAGVEERRLLGVFETQPDIPSWSAVVPEFALVQRAQLEALFAEGKLPEQFQHGFSFSTWMVEMGKYLPYLQDRLRRAGGRLRMETILHIDEAFSAHDTVVNCSGLGSRTMEGVADKSVYPVGGQVVQVERRGEQTIIFDTNGVTYAVPRGNNLILGGTAHLGQESTVPIDATTQDILRRCSEFLPGVGDRSVQNVKVGLRPARPEVRLEEESHPRGRLVHNYGHGGGGVTLSWGCAEDVLRLLEGQK